MSDYDSYTKWKGWDTSELSNSNKERINASYHAILKKAKVPQAARILELGFGNGYFLEWARDHGYHSSGLEIIEELVTKAAANGHEVYCDRLLETNRFEPNSFDAIVAFDVFEHMSVDELRESLKKIDALLVVGGCVIARVPNAGSPFGQLLQNGDMTHLRAFTTTSMPQLLFDTALNQEWAGNSVRVLAGCRQKWKRYIAYILRDFLEWTLGFIYFGRRVAMDPTITLILRKSSQNS
ncbi:MAG: class I SAM-dependent methyltransferase [Opitutales bacterium]|nr:class I SAM-dependent methyltransferase [Opitutales bacterium]